MEQKKYRQEKRDEPSSSERTTKKTDIPYVYRRRYLSGWPLFSPHRSLSRAKYGDLTDKKENVETAIVKSARRNETSYEDVTAEIVDPETRALEKGPCSHIGKVFCCFPWVIAAEKVWGNQALRKTSSSDSPISVTADEEKVSGKLQWQKRLPRYCEGFISCPLPSFSSGLR